MTTYTLNPKGLADLTDKRVMTHKDAEVRKVQPYGCPRNGTMGHCYVERVDTGQFIGLVLETSLEKR